MRLGRRRRAGQRGNVIVEFALAFPLLFVFLGGMFQFGHAFYVYNELQSAVRAGVRFAAQADFDGGTGGATFRTQVRNMVVYGSPSSSGPPPLVNGLTTGNVAVNWQADGAGIPQTVTVNISDFTIYAVWGSFTLSNKPRSTFIWLGQFVS